MCAATKHCRALQVVALEGGYPGGVAAYVKNAKQLLTESAKGLNPFEGMKPEVRAQRRCLARAAQTDAHGKRCRCN